MPLYYNNNNEVFFVFRDKDFKCKSSELSYQVIILRDNDYTSLAFLFGLPYCFKILSFYLFVYLINNILSEKKI